MTMGGLAMVLVVDVDTVADVLEQLLAVTPLPRHMTGTQAATCPSRIDSHSATCAATMNDTAIASGSGHSGNADESERDTATPDGMR